MFKQFTEEFMQNPIGMIGFITMIVGFLTLSIPSIIFRYRALTNQKAWDGKTLPSLKVTAGIFLGGLILFIIGLIIG